MGCILASVFYRFWLIVGAMLGSKIEQKSIKNGMEKMIEKRKTARLQKRRSWTPPGPGRGGRGRGKPLHGGVENNI